MVQANHSTRFTVLLANDSESPWHETIRRLLEPQGVQTISARSGQEALQVIERRPIHVAVLDAQMQQLGGLQVVKLMQELTKANPRRAITLPPAILVANDLTSNLLREALMMHVFSVLGKPVDLNLMLDALARVLRRHHEGRWPIAGADGPASGE